MNTDFNLGTSVPANALRAENRMLMRGGVGQRVWVDGANCVCCADAYSKVWIGELIEQQWHGHAGVFTITTKGPGYRAADIGFSRFVQTVCQSRNYHQWFNGNPAQSISGSVANLQVAFLETVYQHWNDEGRMFFKAAGKPNPICDNAPIQRIGFSEYGQERLQAIFSHERQSHGGTIRNLGVVGVIQHLDQLRDAGAATFTEHFECENRSVRSRLFVVIAPCPTDQWPWNELFRQASRKGFYIIVLERRLFIFVAQPLEEIWQGVCSDLGDGFANILLILGVKVLAASFREPIAQRMAVVAGFGISGKEKDGRHREHDESEGDEDFFAARCHVWRVA